MPLSEFPDWGLDIMMALYGRETIQRARAADVEARLPEPAYVDVEPLSPLQAELEAVPLRGRHQLEEHLLQLLHLLQQAAVHQL